MSLQWSSINTVNQYPLHGRSQPAPFGRLSWTWGHLCGASLKQMWKRRKERVVTAECTETGLVMVWFNNMGLITRNTLIPQITPRASCVWSFLSAWRRARLRREARDRVTKQHDYWVNIELLVPAVSGARVLIHPQFHGRQLKSEETFIWRSRSQPPASRLSNIGGTASWLIFVALWNLQNKSQNKKTKPTSNRHKRCYCFVSFLSRLAASCSQK